MLITDPRWAPWSLDTEHYTLVRLGPEETTDYPVDLERCLDAANVLDRILHVDGGRGRDDRVTLGLLRALDDLLEPRQHLCRFGKATGLTRRRMRDLVDAYVRRAGVEG